MIFKFPQIPATKKSAKNGSKGVLSLTNTPNKPALNPVMKAKVRLKNTVLFLYRLFSDSESENKKQE